jgi:hypothetical protein
MAISQHGGSIIHQLIRSSIATTCSNIPRRALPRVVASSFNGRRLFHTSPVPWGIRSQVLKDVGEGQLVQLFPFPVLQRNSALLVIGLIFVYSSLHNDNLLPFALLQASRKSRSSNGMLKKERISKSGNPFVSISPTKQLTMYAQSSLFSRSVAPYRISKCLRVVCTDHFKI